MTFTIKPSCQVWLYMVKWQSSNTFSTTLHDDNVFHDDMSDLQDVKKKKNHTQSNTTNAAFIS